MQLPTKLDGYDLSLLPDAKEIDVIRINRSEFFRPVPGRINVAEVMPSTQLIPGTVLASTQGEVSQRLLSLFRALPSIPSSQSMRCHEPHYALRLKQNGQQILDASLCFRCLNVKIFTGTDRIWAYFDADSASAQELLGALQQYDPEAGSDTATRL